MIRLYNGEESVQEYLESVNRASKILETSEKVVLAITVVDPYHEIAVLVVARLEEKAVALVQRRLAAQLARIEARIEGWGVIDNRHTRMQKEIALAELRRCDAWLKTVSAQARYEAQSRSNQTMSAANSSVTPTATMSISSSPSATTSRIRWTEGLAMRQLRDVNLNGWSRVLNER